MPGKNPRAGAGSERAWNLKDIEELIDLLIEREITEFEMEKDGLRIRIKRGRESQASGAAVVQAIHSPAAMPPSAAALGQAGFGAPAVVSHPAEPSLAEPAEAESAEGLYIIKSPIVGTFYHSPSPNAPPFVKLGDVVKVGQVLCIIEAMKLMNEIESEADGEITRIYVQNGQPVEYGQSLFAIKPSRKK